MSTYNNAAPDKYTTFYSKKVPKITKSHHDSKQKCNGANHDLYCLMAKQTEQKQSDSDNFVNNDVAIHPSVL